LIKAAVNTFTFALYGAFCIVTLLFVRFIVPETKGRELESISSGSRSIAS
jgi:SP family galactose:H+ symporter-like MFS transporter